MTTPQEFNGGVPGGNYDAVQAPNGTWTIKALPIFSEVEAGKRGNQKHVGPEWMNAAIAKSKELKEVQQHMAPVHLGHHGALKNKDTPRVGFLSPQHIGRLLIEGKPSWCLFADVVGISQEHMGSLKNLSHPYRSVEIGDWNKPEIASLALLSDESPYFKFPMLTIGQMKAHAGTKPIQFGSERDGNYHFFEFAQPSFKIATNKRTGKGFSKMEKMYGGGPASFRPGEDKSEFFPESERRRHVTRAARRGGKKRATDIDSIRGLRRRVKYWDWHDRKTRREEDIALGKKKAAPGEVALHLDPEHEKEGTSYPKHLWQEFDDSQGDGPQWTTRGGPFRTQPVQHSPDEEFSMGKNPRNLRMYRDKQERKKKGQKEIGRRPIKELLAKVKDPRWRELRHEYHEFGSSKGHGGAPGYYAKPDPRWGYDRAGNPRGHSYRRGGSARAWQDEAIERGDVRAISGKPRSGHSPPMGKYWTGDPLSTNQRIDRGLPPRESVDDYIPPDTVDAETGEIVEPRGRNRHPEGRGFQIVGGERGSPRRNKAARARQRATYGQWGATKHQVAIDKEKGRDFYGHEFQSQPSDHSIQYGQHLNYMKSLARAAKQSNTMPAGRIDGQGFQEFSDKSRRSFLKKMIGGAAALIGRPSKAAAKVASSVAAPVAAAKVAVPAAHTMKYISVLGPLDHRWDGPEDDPPDSVLPKGSHGNEWIKDEPYKKRGLIKEWSGKKGDPITYHHSPTDPITVRHRFPDTPQGRKDADDFKNSKDHALWRASPAGRYHTWQDKLKKKREEAKRQGKDPKKVWPYDRKDYIEPGPRGTGLQEFAEPEHIGKELKKITHHQRTRGRWKDRQAPHPGDQRAAVNWRRDKEKVHLAPHPGDEREFPNWPAEKRARHFPPVDEIAEGESERRKNFGVVPVWMRCFSNAPIWMGEMNLHPTNMANKESGPYLGRRRETRSWGGEDKEFGLIGSVVGTILGGRKNRETGKRDWGRHNLRYGAGVKKDTSHLPKKPGKWKGKGELAPDWQEKIPHGVDKDQWEKTKKERGIKPQYERAAKLPSQTSKRSKYITHPLQGGLAGVAGAAVHHIGKWMKGGGKKPSGTRASRLRGRNYLRRRNARRAAESEAAKPEGTASDMSYNSEFHEFLAVPGVSNRKPTIGGHPGARGKTGPVRPKAISSPLSRRPQSSRPFRSGGDPLNAPARQRKAVGNRIQTAWLKNRGASKSSGGVFPKAGEQRRALFPIKKDPSKQTVWANPGPGRMAPRTKKQLIRPPGSKKGVDSPIQAKAKKLAAKGRKPFPEGDADSPSRSAKTEVDRARTSLAESEDKSKATKEGWKTTDKKLADIRKSPGGESYKKTMDRYRARPRSERVAEYRKKQQPRLKREAASRLKREKQSDYDASVRRGKRANKPKSVPKFIPAPHSVIAGKGGMTSIKKINPEWLRSGGKLHEFGSFALQKGQAKRLMGTRRQMGILKLNKNGQLSNKLNMNEFARNSALRIRENRKIARPFVRFKDRTKAKWDIQPPGVGWY